MFCFGFSWELVVWVLLGEMFNNKIRGAALSLAAAVQWIANFAVSTTFPPLLQYFGLGPAYGVYTLAAAISIFFVAFFIKETKGMELNRCKENERKRGVSALSNFFSISSCRELGWCIKL